MEFIAFLCTVDMLVSVLLYVRDRNQADDNCSFSSTSNFLLCFCFDLSCKSIVYLCLSCLNTSSYEYVPSGSFLILFVFWEEKSESGSCQCYLNIFAQIV